jgi:hypothetical protein
VLTVTREVAGVEAHMLRMSQLLNQLRSSVQAVRGVSFEAAYAPAARDGYTRLEKDWGAAASAAAASGVSAGAGPGLGLGFGAGGSEELEDVADDLRAFVFERKFDAAVALVELALARGLIPPLDGSLPPSSSSSSSAAASSASAMSPATAARSLSRLHSVQELGAGGPLAGLSSFVRNGAKSGRGNNGRRSGAKRGGGVSTGSSAGADSASGVVRACDLGTDPTRDESGVGLGVFLSQGIPDWRDALAGGTGAGADDDGYGDYSDANTSAAAGVFGGLGGGSGGGGGGAVFGARASDYDAKSSGGEDDDADDAGGWGKKSKGAKKGGLSGGGKKSKDKSKSKAVDTSASTSSFATKATAQQKKKKSPWGRGSDDDDDDDEGNGGGNNNDDDDDDNDDNGRDVSGGFGKSPWGKKPSAGAGAGTSAAGAPGGGFGKAKSWGGGNGSRGGGGRRGHDDGDDDDDDGSGHGNDDEDEDEDDGEDTFYNNDGGNGGGNAFKAFRSSISGLASLKPASSGPSASGGDGGGGGGGGRGDRATNTRGTSSALGRLLPLDALSQRDVCRLSILGHVAELTDALLSELISPGRSFGERARAIGFLARLDQEQRALRLFLEQKTAQIATATRLTRFHGEVTTYVRDLGAAVFGTVSAAADEMRLLFANNELSAALTVWSVDCVRGFAAAVVAQTLQSEDSLRYAGGCLRRAYAACAVMDRHGMALAPVLAAALQTPLSDAIARAMRRVEAVVATMVTAERWRGRTLYVADPDAAATAAAAAATAAAAAAAAAAASGATADATTTMAASAAAASASPSSGRVSLRLTESARYLYDVVRSLLGDLAPLLSNSAAPNAGLALYVPVVTGLVRLIEGYVLAMAAQAKSGLAAATAGDGGADPAASGAFTDAQLLDIASNLGCLVSDLVPRVASELSQTLQRPVPELTVLAGRVGRIREVMLDSFAQRRAVQLVRGRAWAAAQAREQRNGGGGNGAGGGTPAQSMVTASTDSVLRWVSSAELAPRYSHPVPLPESADDPACLPSPPWSALMGVLRSLRRLVQGSLGAAASEPLLCALVEEVLRTLHDPVGWEALFPTKGGAQQLILDLRVFEIYTASMGGVNDTAKAIVDSLVRRVVRVYTVGVNKAAKKEAERAQRERELGRTRSVKPDSSNGDDAAADSAAAAASPVPMRATAGPEATAELVRSDAFYQAVAEKVMVGGHDDDAAVAATGPNAGKFATAPSATRAPAAAAAAVRAPTRAPAPAPAPAPAAAAAVPAPAPAPVAAAAPAAAPATETATATATAPTPAKPAVATAAGVPSAAETSATAPKSPQK